jgi:VanZ family protein
LYHARPQRKEAYNQALGVEEMRQIVDVIDEAKDVFVDVRDDFKAIIYTFEDKENKEKINKIVVDINHVVKKFGKTNAIITMGKINKVDIEKSLKDGVFAKIE